MRVGQNREDRVRRPVAPVRRGSARTTRSTAAPRGGSRPGHRRGRTAPATSSGRARRTAGSARRCPPRRQRRRLRSAARPARRRWCPGTRPISGPPAAGRAASGTSARRTWRRSAARSGPGPASSASLVASSVHHDAVRRSCQPITGPSGSPVLRRQATTDSRWLEMVTPARVESGWSDARQAATAASTLAQISSASCSIHPGCGDARPTGAAPYPTTCPAWSTPMALVVGRPLVDRQDHRRPPRLRNINLDTGLDASPAGDRLCDVEWICNTSLGKGRPLVARPAQRRVIINTDAKNEADDQFAIVHALLSPTLDVRGLIAAHFGTRRSQRSMAESREEIDLLLELDGPDRQGDASPTAHPPACRTSAPRRTRPARS